MTPDVLKDHAFTRAVFDAVRPVLKVEYDYRQRQGREAEYVPDEYEFYLMRVGNRLATVLSHCDQKVKETEVPNVLKPLRKKLSEFEQARHTVIHRGAYQDDELYRLELYTELEDSYRRSGDSLPVDIAFVPKVRVEMTRELIKKRKAKYARFNSRVLQLVFDLFAVLHERFEEEERRLRILTERGAQPGVAADS